MGDSGDVVEATNKTPQERGREGQRTEHGDEGETRAEREREQHQNNKRGVDLDSEYPAHAAPVCDGWV